MSRPDIKLPYFQTVPTGFDPQKESLPMIVFLHGAGERGPATGEWLDAVKVHGIPKLFGQNPDYGGYRVITLSPQCPVNMDWTNVPLELMALIDEKIEELNADPKRIALTGLSMGGFGTWEMGALYPDRFRALGPVCGGGNPLYADRYQAPIHAYHGDQDNTVPYWRSVDMVNAVTAAGGCAELITCPGVAHGSWVNAYDEGDMIPWLMERLTER